MTTCERPAAPAPSRCAHPRRRRRRQVHGAALLTAMIIVALVATLASSMVWQQWRAVEIETADRARAQSAWILAGALDWARVIMREDRVEGADHLGEPWAVPLAEARMSTFLAADKNNNFDTGPDAFLSGVIVDAQSRYNLYNLIGAGRVPPEAELRVLVKLCEFVGVSGDIAALIATGLNDAAPVVPPPPPPVAGAQARSRLRPANPPLMPRNERQLAWLGIPADALSRLQPYIVLLPKATKVNLNTASREVIAAVVDTLDLAGAERIVQARARAPFKDTAAAQAALGPITFDATRLDTRSEYFEVGGRLRLDDHILEERSLIVRNRANRVITLVSRERTNSQEAMANPSARTSQ